MPAKTSLMRKHKKFSIVLPWCVVILAAFVLAAPSFATDGETKPKVGAAETDPGKQALPEAAYKNVALPFMTTYCFKCHGDDKQESDLNLRTLKVDMKTPETADWWDEVYAQLQFDEMPPAKDDQAQPTASEKAAFLAWLDGELAAVGKGFGLDDKLLLPEYGNYVDHKTLFDGSIKDEPCTPARLWRQRPGIYDALWRHAYGSTPYLSVSIGGTGPDVVQRGPHKGKQIALRYFNDARYANPFHAFVYHASGITDYAGIVADQASLEALLVNGETMAEILTRGLKVSVKTRVKNRDSRTGNNEAMFVGGVVKSHVDYRGRVPTIFRRIVESDEAVSREDFNEALRVTFALFFQREPGVEECEHYWQKVFLKNAPLGNENALQAVLIYATLTPEFVYRMEIGMGEKDERGRRMLSPHELVHAIHHAFDDKPAFGIDDFETVDVYTRNTFPAIKRTMTTSHPTWQRRDGWLVQQMKAGKLKTKADVEAAVRFYLNQPPSITRPNHNSTIASVRNPRILQFFREFFGYHHASSVFKDTEQFAKETRPGFNHFQNSTASFTMYDTDAFVLQILADDKDVLKELLTSTKIYPAYYSGTPNEADVQRNGGPEKWGQRHYLQSYNLNPLTTKPVSYTQGRVEAVYEAPAGQRYGVLTHPSWLLAHSGNFDNDPVRRGKWVREKLLAGVVMDVPINVDAKVPDDEHKTLRERFSVVHNDECWRCHKKMNPLGMPFEAYNHVGRWRATEKGKPAVTTGSIEYTGVQAMEGDVADVKEMMDKIANSELARQSFIRHVFRYWMGRNEMLSDSRTLIAMDKAYVESGGSFKETLVSLLTSDSFLYRR